MKTDSVDGKKALERHNIIRQADGRSLKDLKWDTCLQEVFRRNLPYNLQKAVWQ